MGRWKKYYDEVLTVNVPPFRGSLRVAYEPLEPLIGTDPLKDCQAWVRLDIWKRQQDDRLEHEIPHVNVASCVDDLLEANLQGDKQTFGYLVSLYLTDYTYGREVFQVRQGDEPWKGPIIRPNGLAEAEEVHATHVERVDREGKVPG